MTHLNKSDEFIKREYNFLAKHYDERWASYVGASILKTRDRICLDQTDLLLDVGCGTGSFLKAISNTSPSIILTGVDLSEGMLRRAHEKLGDEADLYLAAADSLPFGSNYFDVVVSNSSLHYWRNPRKCFDELFRVLKPGGQLVITDWCEDFLSCRICDLILRIFDRAHFKTYHIDELLKLVSESKFSGMEIESYKVNWLWGLMTLSCTKPQA